MTNTTDNRRRVLEQRGRRLEVITLVWNLLEAAVTITTGLSVHSLGLVGFGLDSCVEVFASVVVLWHLGGSTADSNRSSRAMKLIAAAFLFLGVYLGFQAVRTLLTGADPTRSWLGLGFLGATVVAMFLLAWGKRVTGAELDNEPLVANASMTLLDGCLAAATLVGVFVAVQFGWWWADALAAGVIAVLALREGIDEFRD